MNNKKLFPHTVWYLITLLTISIGGCASGPLNQEDINKFDGKWTAKIQKTPPSQRQNSWKLKCANRENEFSFEVVDGTLRLKIADVEQEQLLRAGGKFSFDQDTDRHAKETPGSDISIDDGQVTYVIKGKLSGANPSGSLQEYIKEIGAGCITKILYEKVEA